MRMYIIGDRVKFLEDIESKSGKVMIKKGTYGEVAKFNQRFASSDITVLREGSTRIYNVRPRQIELALKDAQVI